MRQIKLQLLQPGADRSSQLGSEGYYLRIAPEGILIEAVQPAGLFYAVQTLRQLLPPGQGAAGVQLPGGEIIDSPRFSWRGAMLDVARHFFGVEDVKRYIDLLAQYKLNVLHLHLSDDQGWRIEIKSWPQLALVGGSTAVNGEGSGYYTQAEYADLVAYAAERFITIVPEIDLPSHTNAALGIVRRAELRWRSPAALHRHRGRLQLAVRRQGDYVPRSWTTCCASWRSSPPGPYIHIGGDEAMSTPPDAYLRFMQRVQPLVQKYGKQVVGWEELGQAPLLPGTLVQQWNTDPARVVHTLQAVEQGAKVIVSPASRTYLDMKYDADTPLGLQWAGLVDVRDAYDWEPTELPGRRRRGAGCWRGSAAVGRDAAHARRDRVHGLAAPAGDRRDRLVAPRRAELGRIPHTAGGPSLRAGTPMDLTYYRSPQVNWP